MSTDFNIKPVGAPVAAPMISPASQTTQKAISTELPASQSVTAPEPSVRVRIDSNAANASQSNQAATKDQVVIDHDAGEVVYQVVDNRTNLVVRQFPEEAALRRRAYFRTLDLSKDASPRVPATDRQV
ncbi:flagellar protein FlaG [Bradyrhizobium genosp. P]|uniref:flagellar protein FlaG n=1 Tax=Bradyrhizobium genosp. P TaxID=83641 RepID=UPI003CE8C893